MSRVRIDDDNFDALETFSKVFQKERKELENLDALSPEEILELLIIKNEKK